MEQREYKFISYKLVCTNLFDGTVDGLVVLVMKAMLNG
jgi:hypothetical protein